MHKHEIREATAADLPAMAALMTQLGYPTTVPEMSARVKAMAHNTDYCCLLAVEAAAVTGMIGFCKCYAWEISDCYIRIQVLVTDAGKRTQGTGAALVDACSEWGRSRGAAYLSLNCGNKEGREAAHRFYPRIGFAITATGYTRRIL